MGISFGKKTVNQEQIKKDSIFIYYLYLFIFLFLVVLLFHKNYPNLQNYLLFVLCLRLFPYRNLLLIFLHFYISLLIHPITVFPFKSSHKILRT